MLLSEVHLAIQMPEFRAYRNGDRDACLQMFDENCPEFFAPNEREDYAAFLAGAEGEYTIVLDSGRIAGAFGLAPHGDALALRWILFARAMQGRGLGAAVMSRALEAMRTRSVTVLHIAASHKSAPFFARFGAQPVTTTADGWGPGMDRVDMVLTVR